jgi:hypothetical protein
MGAGWPLVAAPYLEREVREIERPQMFAVDVRIPRSRRDQCGDAASSPASERPDMEIAYANIVDRLEHAANLLFELGRGGDVEQLARARPHEVCSPLDDYQPAQNARNGVQEDPARETTQEQSEQRQYAGKRIRDHVHDGGAVVVVMLVRRNGVVFVRMEERDADRVHEQAEGGHWQGARAACRYRR